MVNNEISQLFERIADALEFRGANPFRVNAYRRGSTEIADLGEDVSVLLHEGRLTKVPGIGKGMAADIQEYLARGVMTAYEEAMEGIPSGLLDLKTISGLGPKRLALFHQKLGVKDLASLEQAMADGRLAELPGMGEKMVANLEKGIARLAKTRERMPLSEALALSRRVLEELDPHVDLSKAVFAGSLRRGRETCGDLDLLIPTQKNLDVVAVFTKLPSVTRVLAAGDTKGSVLMEGGRQVDLRVVDPSCLGAALLYFTGSKEHNIRLRELAKKKGQKVSEYGLFQVEKKGQKVSEKLLASKTEQDVYAALGLAWVPPEMREDRGEIEAALEGTLPPVLTEKQIKGDLHVRTNAGDGSASLEDLASAAVARKLTYLAVTDSVGSRGLSVEDWKKQRETVDALGDKFPSLRILHGAEVPVGAGGAEIPPEVAESAEFVVAALRSGFSDRVTERLIAAIEHPAVDLIAHPTGRLIGVNSGYAGLDLDAVFEAARTHGVSLEMNASPRRLDLSAENARRAAESGIRLAVSGDVRAPEDFDHLHLGVRTARRGWITKASVVNAGGVTKVRRQRVG